eukprot:gene15354-17172_t
MKIALHLLVFCIIFKKILLILAAEQTPSSNSSQWLLIPPSKKEHMTRKVPLVFIFLMGKECPNAFPDYIKHSLFQAVRIQRHVMDVILMSNFKDCPSLLDSIKSIPFLFTVDSEKIASNSTRAFDEKSKDLFTAAHNQFLWRSSALRLFLLLDFMQVYHYDVALHIEADNLLYHPLDNDAIAVLRQHYPLAVTPLFANKSQMTASVLWVSQINQLIDLIHYLSLIAQRREPVWQHYIRFLRRFFCCKKGGIEADPNTGLGIKPYGLNEMSMLAHYQSLHRDVLKGLPLLPSYPVYPKVKPFADLSTYTAGGADVGVAVGTALWDSGSYGQNLGGTWLKRGRDQGFVDSAHVIGQAMLLAQCEVQILCHNVNSPSTPREMTSEELVEVQKLPLMTSEVVVGQCYSSPFVRCQASELKERATWIPLWNLHIHSKQTEKYISKPCKCSTNQTSSK